MKSKIDIIGLGAGDLFQLPYGIYVKLMEAQTVIYARTLDHPAIQQLQEEGVLFKGFDDIYQKHDDFTSVYKEIVEVLLHIAQDQSVIYAVPGHPMLAEKTVQLLLKEPLVEVNIIGGQSYLDDVFTSLQIDPIEGFQLMDAVSCKREALNFKQHMIFSQVYDQFTASALKLTLLEDLPADYEVIILDAVGTSKEKKWAVPLEEIDRVMEVGNLTSIYVPPVPEELLHHTFNKLRKVIRTLRGPGGCPWDKKQTHESLRKYVLEETYELIDAIDGQDDDAIIEELGDVLLQVMLHSQIGEDEGFFSIDEVIKAITDKMIHRHPHVFGNGETDKSWEELKKEEKLEVQDQFLLDDVSKSAAALHIAYQLQKKAGSVGFDWDNVEAIWEKFHEEYAEFMVAVKSGHKQGMEAEFGDVLFVLANIAKHYEIQPELALHQTNRKFIARFTELEKQMRKQGKKFNDMTLKELDQLWDIAKEKER